MRRDNRLKKFSFVENFNAQLSNKNKWDQDTISKLNSNAIKWYTDGSKMAQGTEIGIHGPKTIYFESLGKNPSIFQADAHAIARCVQFNIEESRTEILYHVHYFSSFKTAIIKQTKRLTKLAKNIENVKQTAYLHMYIPVRQSRTYRSYKCVS